jgi:hypothetical protein
MLSFEKLLQVLQVFKMLLFRFHSDVEIQCGLLLSTSVLEERYTVSTVLECNAKQKHE